MSGLNTDFFTCREELMNEAENLVFTGMIDEYYDYCYGGTGVPEPPV